MKAIFITSVIFLFFSNGFVLAQDQPVGPTLIKTGTYHGLSQPLRDLPVMSQQEQEAMWKKNKENPNNEGLQFREYPFSATALPKGPDPVWQKTAAFSDETRTTQLNYNGSQIGSNPPDPCGDVGPNHYFHAYNAAYVIYDKAGNILAGPTDLNLIFGNVAGSNCNSGDPIILYDEQADRWVVIEFSLCNANDYVLVAVSQTSDPTGAFYQYSFDTDEVPDYEKVGVWRDGYYMATNTSGTGHDIYVMERSVMLAGGASPDLVRFDNPWRPISIDGFMCVPPVDNDGTFAPSGSPGLFIAFNDDAIGGGSDQIWIYELLVNWVYPANSSFTRSQMINVAAFNSNFGLTWDNIAQPNTSQELDAVPAVIMNAPQYRNFGTYQTIVCCHTVDVDNTDHAGIRWYELRRTNGNWSIRQQGTYAPDAHSRWMASIRLNNFNEIGLGYSISSSTVYPGIRYCGQDADEYALASGVMNVAETTIVTGAYSQTGSRRWGDYSSLNVDPKDDQSFWYTNMHVLSDNATKQTVIASFRLSPLVIYVDKTAAAGGDGTAAHPFNNVTEAVNHATNETIISIKANTYDEPPVLFDIKGMVKATNGSAIIK